MTTFSYVVLSIAALSRAIVRCREMKPRVRPMMSDGLALSHDYEVRRADLKRWAHVRLFINSKGEKCAQCDCDAARRPTPLCCYHIAAAMALHCARVRAHSTAPERGADFCRDLPKIRPRAISQPEAPASEREKAIAAIERQMKPAIEAREAAARELRATARSMAHIENASEIDIADLCAWQHSINRAVAKLEAQ